VNMINWSQEHRPMHILIVDDDKDMLTLLEATLRARCGDTVRFQSVASPKKASELLETNLIDILITDMEMPGINGLQLLRCAKRRNAWTQVIMVTGHSETETLTSAMDLGACDYLTKPLDPAELEHCLCEASARFRRWRNSLQLTLMRANSL
jgi:DNA-binding NtrC family response regulator